jgi:hypothetical protein
MKLHNATLQGLFALFFSFLTLNASVQAQIAAFTPTDPGYDERVAVIMDLPYAWWLSTQSPDNEPESIWVVADGNIPCDHSELVGVCLPQYNKNFTTDDPNAPLSGPTGHTLAIAAMVAGGFSNGNQATPVSGVKRKTRIIAGQVVDANGESRDEWIRKMLDYAVYLKTELKLNVKGVVCPIAMKGADSSPSETRAIFRRFVSGDLVLVIPVPQNTANPGSIDDQNLFLLSNARVDEFPDNVIAVTSLSADGENLTPISQWGEATVAFALPSENIKQATYPDKPNLTISGSGSSIATAEMAGIIDLVIRSGEPSPTKAVDRIKATAKLTPGLRNKVKYGIAQGGEAITRDFTAPKTGLSLASQPNSPRAIALDSVTWLKDLFIRNDFNFSPDRRTRVVLVSESPDVLSARGLSIQLRDGIGIVATMTIEDMRVIPNHTPQSIQITTRVPDIRAGEYWAYLIDEGGNKGNKVLITIK